MAFECQKSTEVSEIVVNCFSDSNHKAENRETSQPKLLADSNKGALRTLSSEELPLSNGLSNRHHSFTDLPLVLISHILNSLGPRELGVVSCVSTALSRLASESPIWKKAYCERWGLPIAPSLQLGAQELDPIDPKTWKEQFGERMFRTRTFYGRYSIDTLYGHTEAVRTVFVLVSAKLLFTSGYDSVVRMWELEDGVSLASSRPLGSTIRAVAADTKLLVAAGTNGFIQGWRAVKGLPHLFDLRDSEKPSSEFRIWEHEGPVTSLSLDLQKIYSGSWDTTVRVWDRRTLQCLKVMRHSDWVWALAPHGTTIVSTSGPDVYVWDTDSGNLLTIICGANSGNAYCLARSLTGDFFFSGGDDGAIHMFEITSSNLKANVLKVATWIPHTGTVYSLAFEFPWLVSAASDGKLSLIDVRKLMRTRTKASTIRNMEPCGVEPPQRMLHGFGPNLFSVGVGADRIICGGEDGVVRIWDFSEALEIDCRANAIRGIRLENRMRRRKLQRGMSNKSGKTDQCSAAAKKNHMHADRSGVWHNKRGVSSKA